MSNSANNQCEKHKLTTKTINQSGQVLTISGCHPMDEVFVSTTSTNSANSTSTPKSYVSGTIGGLVDHCEMGYLVAIEKQEEYASGLRTFAKLLAKVKLIPWALKSKREYVNKESGFLKSCYNFGDFETSKCLAAFDNLSKTNLLAIAIGPIRPDRDLVVLDFENPTIMSEVFKKLEDMSPEVLPRLKESYTETSMSGGHHILLWVPSGSKKEKLAKDENEELLIEILGGPNTLCVIAPSRGYKAINGPLLDDNGELNSIATLDSDQINIVLSVCRTFHRSPKPINNSTKPIQTNNSITPTKNKPNVTCQQSEKNHKLNEFLLSEGWSFLLDHFGYRHKPNGHGGYHVWHPDSTDFDSPNCTAGPKEAGDGNTFKSWSTNWNIGFDKPINLLSFWMANGGKYSELCHMAKANGIKLDDDVDESRFSEFQPPNQTETKSSEASGDMGGVSEDTLKKKIREYETKVEEAEEAERVLRPKTEGSLIAEIGDMLKHNALGGYEPSVLPYSCAMAYMAHYSADQVFFSENTTVFTTMHVAPTSYGKGLAFNVFKMVDEILVKKENELDTRTPFEDAMSIVDKDDLSPDPKGENGITHRKKKIGRFNNWVEARIKPASSQGLEDAIKLNPHCMIIFNEFSDTLAGTKGKGDDAERTRAIINALKEIWDCLHVSDCRSLAKDGSKERIEAPMGNIVTFSVPDLFYKNFDPDFIRSGGLNRVQVFFAGPPIIIDGPIQVSEITSLDPSGEGFASIAERARTVSQNKKSQNEMAEIIAYEIYKRLEFYHNLSKERGTRILPATDCFLKAEREFTKRLTQKLTYNAIMGIHGDNVIGRKRQTIYRYALLHCWDRIGTELMGIDFEWGAAVTDLSNKEQQKIVSFTEKTENLNGTKETFERIGKFMHQQYEKGKPITPGVIASNVFTKASDKEKRNATYFKIHWEPKLVDNNWINVIENNHYELTTEFFKDAKSWRK